MGPALTGMEQIDNYFDSDHLGRIPLVARLMAMLPSAPHVFDGSPPHHWKNEESVRGGPSELFGNAWKLCPEAKLFF